MQIDPKDSEARVMAAAVAEKLGDLRGAYTLLQSAVDDYPEDLDARTSLGRLLITAGDPRRGLEVIGPALVSHPGDATLLTFRAAGKSALNDRAGARADADRALRIDPANEDAIDVRAGLYRQDGNLPAAIKLVSDAAVARPDVAGFRQILVSLYETTGETALAENQLRALVKLKPNQLAFRAQLAMFLVRGKRPDDAGKVLDDAVRALPGNDAAKLLRVQYLAENRSHQAGEQALRDYIKADYDNYALRMALGSLLQGFGETPQAIAAYQDVVQSAGTGTSGLAARDRLAAIAIAQKQEPQAQNYLAEVLKSSPRDNDALAMRGQLALEHGDTAGAIADLRAVLRDQPRSAPINALLAQALVRHGDMALAEEPMRTAVEVEPRNAKLRLTLAELLVQLQHPDQAVALIEEGIKGQPADDGLNTALAQYYLSRKNLAEAQKIADAYRQARPNDAPPYLLAGRVAIAAGRLDEAQALLEKALTIQPHAYDALADLVGVQLRRGQEAQAVSRLQGLMAADPKDAVIPNLLGELYLQQKEFKSAQQILSVAIANQPTWWLPYRNLAMARDGAHDTAGAIAAYQEGLKLAPAQAGMLAGLGTLYQLAGRVDDATALYESWIRQDPRSQIAANNLAMLLVTYRNDKSSLDRAQALTAGFAAADNGDLLDTAGWVQFKRGDYTQAVPVLQHAVQMLPNSPEVRYHLGMAELRAGQTDRARTDLETALAGSPQFSGAVDARAALASLKNRISG
jgi:tetratricopeptide (TPR) repeat protein